MIIAKEIIIDKDAGAAWKVLGLEFADAYKWASAVNHSEGKGNGIYGASCSGRGCETSMGKLKEKLLHYSNENHTLSYEVEEGMPSVVKYATNTWTLVPLGKEKSKLQMEMKIQFKGIMGVIMQPMMKIMMSKMGNELTEELKYYVEYGQAHPRKIKAVRKDKGRGSKTAYFG